MALAFFSSSPTLGALTEVAKWRKTTNPNFFGDNLLISHDSAKEKAIMHFANRSEKCHEISADPDLGSTGAPALPHGMSFSMRRDAVRLVSDWEEEGWEEGEAHHSIVRLVYGLFELFAGRYHQTK
jgi:hypothetical protein